MSGSPRARPPKLLSEDEAEGLARRVYSMAKGSRIQVDVSNESTAENQFARGDAHLARERTGVRISLALEIGGDRQASGATNQTDDASLRALVREVEALAREQRTPRVWDEDDLLNPYLPPQVYPEGPQIFFDDTVEATAGEAQAEVFRRATDAAEAAGLIAAGDIRASAYSRAMLNSRGFWGYHRRTSSEFSMTARTKDGTGSGWAWSGFEDWNRVRVDEVIARAVELGRRSANPVAVEPGRYTVILEPAAVATLVYGIIGQATEYMSAEVADGGGSVFSKEPRGTNKIGLQMMDRRLNLASNPWDLERPGATMGVRVNGTAWRPLVPVTWFEQGVLRNLYYDPSYAKKQRRAPVLNPGGARLWADGPPQTLDEMIASTKRGIWVNRLDGAAVIEPMTVLATGTTRDGTFLIENGRITKPIKNFRFTESPFYVLNRLEAWGEPVRAARDVVAPRLKLHEFNFTSLTEAI